MDAKSFYVYLVESAILVSLNVINKYYFMPTIFQPQFWMLGKIIKVLECIGERSR